MLCILTEVLIKEYRTANPQQVVCTTRPQIKIQRNSTSQQQFNNQQHIKVVEFCFSGQGVGLAMRSRVRPPAVPLPRNAEQVVRTCAFVTKQYNLELAALPSS